MENKKKITLGNKQESQVLGVCAGISNYLNIDVVWLRLAFLIGLFTGIGLIPYICCYIVFPKSENEGNN